MSSCKVCGSATGSETIFLCAECFNAGAEAGSADRRTKAAIAADAGFVQLGNQLREIAKRSRGRPRLGAEVMITRSIQVPPSQWAALEAVAAASATSTGALVRQAIARELERLTAEPPPDADA